MSLSIELILGEGRFGTCKKESYRGNIVAVKYFKESTTPQMVEKEAKMINSFDHPGKYLLRINCMTEQSCGLIFNQPRDTICYC